MANFRNRPPEDETSEVLERLATLDEDEKQAVNARQAIADLQRKLTPKPAPR